MYFWVLLYIEIQPSNVIVDLILYFRPGRNVNMYFSLHTTPSIAQTPYPTDIAGPNLNIYPKTDLR